MLTGIDPRTTPELVNSRALLGHGDEIVMAEENCSAVREVLAAAKPAEAGLGTIERQDLYTGARAAFAVVHTSEARPFGCFILRKGVVF